MGHMEVVTKQTNQLHDMRVSAGISPEHLAYKLGIATKTIYNWEHTPDVKPHQLFAYRVAIEEVTADRSPLNRGQSLLDHGYRFAVAS